MAAFGEVLIVDDEPAVLAFMRIALTPVFRKLVTAGSAADAIAAWRERGGRFDLVVTDIAMPGASGFELADALLAHNPGVRVLFVSGHCDDAELNRRLAGGRCGFVSKPFGGLDLASAAVRLLERR